MTEIRPFAGLRFARDPEPRIAPPYDVLTQADRERFACEAESVVHLTLPPGPEGQRDYGAAASTLERWIREGALVRESKEQLYLLAEHTASGRVRRGIFALLRLADYEDRVVLPHERTMPGPKRDRLLLTRETRANLEPLFFLYEDRDGKVSGVLDRATGAEILASVRGPDGTGLELRSLSDGSAIGVLQGFLTDRPVVIADGHHRYETMLRYRDECRQAEREAGREPRPDAPWEFVLAYLVNAFDPGTEIRAIHRLARGETSDAREVLKSRGFAVEDLGAAIGAPDLLQRLAERRGETHAFGFTRSRSSTLLATRPREVALDVEVLHEELLPAIGGELSFDAEPERVLATARAGEAALAVHLNPLAPDELFRAVGAGNVLPQKSTYFAPKVPSGLVLRSL